MAINLTTEQLDELKAAEARIVELHKELDRAEQAGLNVDDLRSTLQEAERLRSGMMAVYGRPPRSRRS